MVYNYGCTACLSTGLIIISKACHNAPHTIFYQPKAHDRPDLDKKRSELVINGYI